MQRGRKLGIAAALAAALGGTAAAAALAAPFRAAAPQAAQAQLVACSQARVGLMGPFTGPAASIGQEQLKWARFALQQFNRANKTRFRFVESDTQLDAAQASTRATQLRANPRVLAVVGPAGSQEVLAVRAAFRSMAYISASATRTDLTVGRNRIRTFFRVVGNDDTQARTDADFIRRDLKARRVWIIDDQSAYSVPLANTTQRLLQAAGVSVTRESVSQDQTDFSSLIARIPANTQVVFLPWQLAARAMTFYQQLRTQGKGRITIVGSDGLDSADFMGANGSYFSAFAPDIKRSTNPAVQAIVRAYRRQFGDFKSNFGPPKYVATQAVLTALKAACRDGNATRAEVLREMRRVNLKTTILGYPLRFKANGDPASARFFLFQVRNGRAVFIR